MTIASGVVLRAEDMPAVGNAAPGFTLNSQEGERVSLEEFRGKWVVLYFYPKDMTSGCTLEAHNFQRDLAQYDKRNAVIVGVSVDTLESHQEFCTKESLTFKLLSDTDHIVLWFTRALRRSGCGCEKYVFGRSERRDSQGLHKGQSWPPFRGSSIRSSRSAGRR